VSPVCLAFQKILYDRMVDREMDYELTEAGAQKIPGSLLVAIGVIAIYEGYAGFVLSLVVIEGFESSTANK
jgi:hypothetical protein